MSRKQQLKADSKEGEKKRKRYLRKKGLMARYGDICEKTVDRWRKLKRIPEPDFYQGNSPFWSEERLEKLDREAEAHSKVA